jgi:methylmalonyl-CoA mutase cobalamin-binding subunit
MEVVYTGLHQTPEQIVETAFRRTPTRSVCPFCPART